MGNVNGTSAPRASVPQDYVADARAEAERLFGLRAQCAADSQAAWKRGDRQAAKALSDKSKGYERQAHAAQARAADAIFKHNNEGRTDGMVDLHGLFVAEAVERAEKALLQAKSSGAQSLVFIVGRGNHSADGVCKLRPAVQELIMRHNLRCTPNSPHAGCLLAEFVSKEQRGWVSALLHSCAIM